MSYTIDATSVTKVYSDSRKALDEFSLRIPEKGIYSLLGRNGAGKTTFAKIVSTILEPTKGEVKVLGFDVMKEAERIRERIAIVPQEGRPFSLTTPLEHVLLYLIARGWSMSDARRKAKRVLEELELSEYSNNICSTLSGGLKQRVMLAMATSVEPELLLLDEPTIGLDPLARIRLWGIIQNMNRSGTRIFLTTHYMDEAETLSEGVAILDNGKKIAEGSPRELKASVKATTAVLIMWDTKNEDLSPYGTVLRNGPSTRVFTNESGGRELAERVLSMKDGLSVSVRPITLEDVFIYMVGSLDV